MQMNLQLRSPTPGSNNPSYFPSSSQNQYSAPTNGLSYGSTATPNNQNLSNNAYNACNFPRTLIGGICRCPNDGIYLAGNCIARDQPSKNCNPPRTLISGECICPNNEVYTSENKCISFETSNDPTKNSGTNECK